MVAISLIYSPAVYSPALIGGLPVPPALEK
jgi:hypothetical protein